MTKEEKQKKLRKSIANYNDSAEKKGLRSKAGFAKDMPDFGKIELLKTGLYKFDKYIGGIPKGRYTEIYGPSAAGKSTLIETIMGSLQKQDLMVALANNERNYEERWAAKQGLDVKELIGGNFSDLEECLNFAVQMAETDGACDILTVDTISALSSKQEQVNKKAATRDMDDDTMALIPRKLSQFFRIATAKVCDAKMALLLVNQVRANIGSYGGGMSDPGGNALQHNLSLKLMITRAKCDKEAFKDTHFNMNIKVEKSKFQEAREQTKFSSYFKIGQGIDNNMDIIMDAIDTEIIKKEKSTYMYGKLKAVGYDKLESLITEHNLYPELVSKLNNLKVENEPKSREAETEN